MVVINSETPPRNEVALLFLGGTGAIKCSSHPKVAAGQRLVNVAGIPSGYEVN